MATDRFVPPVHDGLGTLKREGQALIYVVDDLDAVLKLHDAPWPNIGAPLPVILCDESRWWERN